MAMRYVVAVDGSEPAQHAVAHAVALARRTGAVVSVCSVVDPTVACMPVVAGATIDPGPMLDVLEDDAQAFCREAAAHAADQRVVTSCAILHGTPAAAIAGFARDQHADLLIVGTHARTGLARGILGSVAAAVVRTSSVPVLAVRSGVGTDLNGPIVVAVDESPPSTAAAETAVRFARALGIGIHFVHVFDSADLAREWNVDDQAGTHQRVRTAFTNVLTQMTERATAAGVACTSELRYGRIVESLLAAAAERHATIVASGTHGRGAVERLVLGSVAESLLRESTVPVLTAHGAA